MKIYSTSTLSIDRYVGKEFWVRVHLGQYYRLWDNYTFNDEFDQECWARFLYKGREDSVLAGKYVFNGIWDATEDKLGPFALGYHTADLLNHADEVAFYADPKNIQIVTPVDMYTTEEFFGTSEDENE